MSTFNTRQILLTSRPQGLLKESDIARTETTLDHIDEGQIIIKNRYLSLDPAISVWMSDMDNNYLPPIPLGHPVWCTVIGEIVKSRSTKYAVGDTVWGMGNWSDYSIAPEDYVFPADMTLGLPINNHLSVLGAVGMTGYYGILDVGKPVAGETVLISAAAGAVGSIAGQIAKISGCHGVGLAGTQAKCDWITKDLGFDGAINYRKTDNMAQAIANVCPNGVDIYFDNVGGEILSATLKNLAKNARILFCGWMSTYNNDESLPGPHNMWQILAKTARLEGFLISDYFGDFENGVPTMANWVKDGKIKFKEDIVEGLENTPEAFLKLFNGTNDGKLMVKV